jgi:hypothetical protein
VRRRCRKISSSRIRGTSDAHPHFHAYVHALFWYTLWPVSWLRAIQGFLAVAGIKHGPYAFWS